MKDLKEYMPPSQHLFNALSELGVTALVSEMHAVIDAVKKDNEEVAAEINKELLGSLKELVRVYEHGDFHSEFKPALERARKAIELI
jgi:hypothetical protein